MSQDDQDALAAEWAAQLEAEGNEDGADPFEALQADGDAPAAMPSAGGGGSSEEDLANSWAEALAADEEENTGKDWKKSLASQASEATFKDMSDIARRPTPDGSKRELDFILDIPLDVSVELGRTRLLINELLQLGQGSVVELNKLAGEPLEVFVNGKLVARGEAVVINEKFGVRLTDIISPMERVKQLG